MKKYLYVTVFLLIVFMCGFTYGDKDINDDISLYIDGERVLFNEISGIPFIDINNRVQIPFRIVLEKINATVEWDSASQSAIARKDNTKIKIPINKNMIIKNNKIIKIDTSAIIVNKKTYLPIRPVMEIFNYDVTWDKSSKTISIDGKDSLFKELTGVDVSKLISITDTKTSTITIKNISTYDDLVVTRHFLGKNISVATLNSGESFKDSVPYDGTTYEYSVKVCNKQLQTKIKATTTIADITKERGLFYKWENVIREYQSVNAEQIINCNIEEGILHETYLHGVKFSVFYDKNVVEDIKEEDLNKFYEDCKKYFNRQWLLYEGFPVDGYRIAFIDSDFSGMTGGHAWGYAFYYNRNDNLEDLLCNIVEVGIGAHEIGHVWCGNTIFSEKDESGDGWYVEGINMLNEYLVLGNDYAPPSLGGTADNITDRLKWLTKDIREEQKSLPLAIIMGNRDKYKCAEYIKGCLFAYLCYERLEENNLSYSNYLKYVYDNYYLSKVKKYDPKFKTFFCVKKFGMLSPELLQSLEEFSGISFKDLFDKYVYGKEYMDVKEIIPIEVKWQY